MQKPSGHLPLPQRVGIAAGAGIAAALLFVVTAKGTWLALLLAYLAPLPIFIVSLGWGLDAGALAGIVAGAAVSGAIEPLSGPLFVAAIALPAWILSAVVVLPRAFLTRRAPPPDKPWLSVGWIVVVAAAIGAAIGLAATAWLIVQHGGYAQGVEALAKELTPQLQPVFDEVLALPPGFTVEQIAALVVRLSPSASALSTLTLLSANLYVAARSVQLSHRLTRPWPDVPTSLVLPPALGALLIASLALSFLLPAPTSQIAWIGVAALGGAYLLQGLAVLHAISRGLPLRPALLAGLYLGAFITLRWSPPILVFVGLLDSLLSLRARRAVTNKKP